MEVSSQVPCAAVSSHAAGRASSEAVKGRGPPGHAPRAVCGRGRWLSEPRTGMEAQGPMCWRSCRRRRLAEILIFAAAAVGSRLAGGYAGGHRVDARRGAQHCCCRAALCVDVGVVDTWMVQVAYLVLNWGTVAPPRGSGGSEPWSTSLVLVVENGRCGRAAGSESHQLNWI